MSYSARIRKSLSVKGNVAEAQYFVPYVPNGSNDINAHLMDVFVGACRARGLSVYGQPVVEVQQELFEHGSNVRIASFVRKT